VAFFFDQGLLSKPKQRARVFQDQEIEEMNYMILLDTFISQTGKHTADWTSQDIRKYLAYVNAQVKNVTVLKGHDSRSPVCAGNGMESSISGAEAVHVRE
jgi:hypothetical protein